MFLRLIVPLGLAAFCWAQQPAAPGRLKVNIIAGQGAVNNIVVGVGAQPIVEVLDEKDAPVVGADVTFEAPAGGAGGTFFGKQTQTVKTDAKGRALGTGFSPNSEQGRFQILVKAVAGAATGENTITQSNGGPGMATNTMAPPNRKKMWTILAIVAGAAVGGGVAASRGDDNGTTSATKRPVTIGAGPITVGGPR